MLKGLLVKGLVTLFMATSAGIGSPTPTAVPGESQVKISWPAATQPVFGVAVEESLDSGTTWSTALRLPPTSTHANIQNLTNGKSYWFRLRWIWIDGSLGIPSPTLVEIPVSSPGAPTGLVATAGTNQIGLSWDHDPNKSITGYEINQSIDGGNSWAVTEKNTGSVSSGFLVNNLKEGVTYTYRIRAIGFGGSESEFSDSAVAKIATVPVGGYALHFIIKDSKVVLTWDSPSDLPNVQSYDINVSGDGGVNWFKIVTTPGNVNSAVVPYVIGGSTYQVTATSLEGLTSLSQIELVQTNKIPIPDSSNLQTSPSGSKPRASIDATASPRPQTGQSGVASSLQSKKSNFILILAVIIAIALIGLIFLINRSRKPARPKRKNVRKKASSRDLRNRRRNSSRNRKRRGSKNL